MSKFEKKIYYSKSYNVWYNQALEKYLFDNLNKSEIILYLWRNENSVVIGRNQNPWKESRCRLLETNKGKLARRLSGGGAVYHDLGNLNFTFIMPRQIFDIEKQLLVIIKGLKKAGIEAEKSEKKDLTFSGKKFSGNAFYLTSEKAYHHGTVLFESNLEKMRKFLQPEGKKINAKGINSNRAEVINLSFINSKINIDSICNIIRRSFSREYGAAEEVIQLNPENMPALEKDYSKYSSWDWKYGASPKFKISYCNNFVWGGVKLNLTFKNSKIINTEVFSNNIDKKINKKITNLLEGASYKKSELRKSLFYDYSNSKTKKIIKDLKDWLVNEPPFYI